MAKFNNGNTYLGKKDSKWWIIHQSGKRSWTATVFSHTQGVDDESTKTSNGTDLYLEFTDVRVYRCGNNSLQTQMRKDMFNLLKWGDYIEPSQLKEIP